MDLFSQPKAEKTAILPRLRTASKTVRKFTSRFVPNWLPESVSVNLDWYSSMATCPISEPEPGQVVYWITGDLALEYQERGTTNFKHSYKVIYCGEPVANLHTHTTNAKFIKPGRVKFELLNHVLYSSQWAGVKEYIFEALKISEEKMSRLDIAIDGVNHLPVFLNAYAKQPRDNKRVHLKGKATFDPGIQDHKTMNFINFKVGRGHKKISVYNKSSELEKSHKEYIREVWDKCGLDTGVDVWRCELRMDSQGIDEIADIDIERFADPHYLLSIFRTQVQNFFEFIVVSKDSNVSRAKVIDLFQFKKLLVTVLQKIPRAVVRGAYKAKMAIHNAIACTLLGYHKEDSAVHALNHVADLMNLFNLERWYRRKLPQWCEVYQPHGMTNQYSLIKQLVKA